MFHLWLEGKFPIYLFGKKNLKWKYPLNTFTVEIVIWVEEVFFRNITIYKMTSFLISII